jgi:hypothetical protein
MRDMADALTEYRDSAAVASQKTVFTIPNIETTDDRHA